MQSASAATSDLWTRQLKNKWAEFLETLHGLRYQYVDDPYFQVTLCDYSCLTDNLISDWLIYIFHYFNRKE